MKQLFTYKSFLRGIIYLLLVGQLWVNVVSYTHWVVDSEIDLIELCDIENVELEKDKEKEKEKELRVLLPSLICDFSTSNQRFLYSEDFVSLYYPESMTPPPELLLV